MDQMTVIRDEYTYVDEDVMGTNGNDLIMWSGAKSGSDFIDGGGGQDVLSINANSSSFTMKTKGSGLTYLNDVSNGFYNKFGNAVLKNVEKIEFLDKTVKIGNEHGGNKKSTRDKKTEWNEIFGTKRQDELTGTRRGDHLYGGKGDDRLSGGAGDDLIQGGEGFDILSGGSGEDWYALSKKSGKGKKNWDYIEDFEVGKDVIMVMGSTKGLWIDNYQGDAILVSGKNDIIAWVEGAGGQLEWGGSDGNLIM